MRNKQHLKIFAALLRGQFSILILLFFNHASVAQCGSYIATFPYTEGFEAAPSWTAGGTNSSWAWGTPAHPTISSAGGGSKCWCTGGLTGSSYSGAQQSWILSPCFDFSSLNYPWISFKIFWECEYVWDGMVLQYSLNGGSTWTNVGAVNDPVNCLNANWYNYNNISNLTSNPKNGWCGRIGSTVGSCMGGNGSAGWVTAKHCLTGLANQSSVRFRFLFGSGTTCNSYDGIAIDDILIQDAPSNAANFSYQCSGATVMSFSNSSAQCPTSFQWNFGDPASTSANTSTLANPTHTFSSAGNYTVSLTASGPCNASSTTLMPVSILSLSTTAANPSCNGGSNGSSTVTASWGQPAYSYTWLPSVSTGSVATGLSAGTYTVLVKDAAGSCVASHTALLSQPPAITAAITKTNVSCFNLSNGAVSATASAGSSPYSYTWSPPATASQSIGGLPQGIYSLTVKDQNNCQASFTTVLIQPSPLLLSFTIFTVSCYGGSNGVMVANCSGGTPGYSYTWTPSLSSASVISGLGQGSYSVAVTDVNNCPASGGLFLSQPVSPLNGSIFTNTPTCGAANGGATVVASGGNAGYTYSWMPGGSTLSAISGLGGGTFSVNIKDQTNCVNMVTVSIAPSLNLSVNLNIGNTSCYGLSNGSATANVSGGISPYTYTWLATSQAGQGTPMLTGISPGNYSLHVKDANNCPASAAFTVSSPPALSLNYNPTQVSCNGGNNGGMMLAASGGVPAYSYSLAPFGAVSSSVTNLPAGIYTVTVKDNNNCVFTATASIQQPPVLTVTTTQTNVLCYGASNGAITALVNGGTPIYTFSWMPSGGSTALATMLTAGTYSLVIKDAGNCVVSSVVSLTQPAQPLSGTAAVKPVTCFGGSDGGATVLPVGGTPGYTYGWYNFTAYTSTVSGLSARNYSVLITDSHSCSTTVTLSVSEPPPVVLTLNSPDHCPGKPAILSASVTGGYSPLTYNWSGNSSSSNTFSANPSVATVYTVFATDVNGCVSNTDTVLVTIPQQLRLNTTGNFSVCEGQKAWLTASATGGDGNYVFLWQPGGLQGPSHNILPTAGQIYTVSVNDGCQSKLSSTVALNYYSVPPSEIISSKITGCAPVCVTFSNVALQNSGIIKMYAWTFGDKGVSDLASPMHCYNSSGNFAVQLNYATIHGCAGSLLMSHLVHVDPQPVAAFTTDKPETDAYSPTINFINRSTGATGYNWFFSNEAVSSDENPVYSFAGAGKQLVVLIAENEFGCRDTAMKKIEVKPEFTFFAPEAFSPNGDGLNDVFLPVGIGWNFSKYELSVYDRWGEKIFATNNSAEGWAGRARGGSEIIKNDIYTWKVLLFDIFNKRHDFIGHVWLENKEH